MVIFEAARAIKELSGVTSRELTPAITVLQLFEASAEICSFPHFEQGYEFCFNQRVAVYIVECSDAK